MTGPLEATAITAGVITNSLSPPRAYAFAGCPIIYRHISGALTIPPRHTGNFNNPRRGGVVMPSEIVERFPPPRLKTRPQNTNALQCNCTLRVLICSPPPEPLHAQLPEPCWEPPWDPSFSWPRFLLWRDLCLGVGLENQFRFVKKRAPKVRSFSSPKNERTRWAPTMGAHLVIPKMGPEFDPSLWGTTLQNFKTSARTFLEALSTQISRGASWSPD